MKLYSRRYLIRYVQETPSVQTTWKETRYAVWSAYTPTKEQITALQNLKEKSPLFVKWVDDDWLETEVNA